MPDYSYNPNGFDASPSFNWYGFTAPQVSSYFGNIGTPAVEAMAEALNGTSGPQAMSILQQLDPTTIQNMQSGFQNLAEHPEGSTYHGDFSVPDLLANIGTGGYYGLGKAALSGVQGNSSPLNATVAGLNNLGIYGSAAYPISPKAAMYGNAAGAIGAGGASMIGGGGGAGAGAGAMDAGPGSMVGVSEAGEPLYLVKTGTGVTEMTAAQAQAAGIGPMPFGSVPSGGAPGVTGGNNSALMGASMGASALSKMLFPQGGGVPGVPSAFPQGGAMPGGPSPQQLSAIASEKHPGLAPWYGMKQKGQMPPGGIAESNEALATMTQNPSMWMR